MVIFKAKNYIDELDLIIKNKFEKLETDKKLAIINIGKDTSNEKFLQIKQKTAEFYGIEIDIFNFKNSAKKNEVFQKIQELNESNDYGGIVVQYPFPEKFTYQDIASKISPKKDVDFFTPENFGKFALNYDTDFCPPTVKSLDFVLNTFKLEVQSKNYVVFGQGVLVGRPISTYLLNRGATLHILNQFSSEESLKILKDADCVILGASSPQLINGDMLKRGASVIDFSGNFVNNKLVGDFNINSTVTHLNVVSSVPGGVGPLTVRFLFLNFLDFIEKFQI